MVREIENSFRNISKSPLAVHRGVHPESGIDAMEGLEAGADDYLTKPFDRHELRARLRVGRRVLKLQQDLINAREELRFQATLDLLTGTGIGEPCSICCIEN